VDYCTGTSPHGFECGNPAVFAVYLETGDAEGACGKHLAQVVRRRVRAGTVKYVKVCEVPT
jgi:hypothetical protein